MGSMAARAQIVVKGIVQGVGFRPFVFNLAGSLDLRGYVTNTSEGVLIEIEGQRLPEFVERLQTDAPPLARITDVAVTSLPYHGYIEFVIRRSMDSTADSQFTLISPDISVCEDCHRELFEPSDRRYLYPFVNCTNCGPRFSITRSVPYDRPNTTMAGFTMCPDCLREYHDPRNRRFHAQPNACATCGPHVVFRVRGSGFGVKGSDAFRETIKLLLAGGIVAVKGIGGFHLACDAGNDAAVRRLREKKRKNNKPFAVMTPTAESAGRYCEISEAERNLLLSIRRPIVLLRKKAGQGLSNAVSPDNQFTGFMLPYTPLHYLLFYQPLDADVTADGPHFEALVMTSGNLSEEPIVRDNEEAIEKLSGTVDGFLLHDRDIFMRVDDSVVRVQTMGRGDAETGRHADQSPHPLVPASPHRISFIRRSRGYA